jgi:hypothetical protein
MALDDAAVHASRVPGWLRFAIAAPALGSAGWFCLRGSGPYAWLADLQMSVFGAYYPVLTGLFVVILFLLPAAFVVQVLAAIWPAPRSAESDAAVRANFARQDEAIRTMLWPVALAATGVICLGLAGWSAIRVVTMGELTAWTLNSDSVWPPPSNWLDLRGRLDLGISASYEDEKTHTVRHYIPVCPIADGKDDAGAACPLVAEVYEAQWVAYRLTHTAEGTLGGPPSGLVRDALESRGARLTPDAQLFHVGDNPDRALEMAQVFGGTGLLLEVIGVGLWMFKRRRTS